MRFYTYAHEYLSGPKIGRIFYIGKGSGRRAWNVSTRSRHWKAIVDKYGYVVKILDSGISESQAFEFEKFLIETIGKAPLCNFTDGGEGLANPSKEVREKLRLSHIGKKHTDSQKLKISIAGKGRRLSPEHKESLRLGRVGYVTSDKTKSLISKARTGSAQSKSSREASGTPVKCSNGMIFKSAGFAVEWLITIGKLRAQKTPIFLVCKGLRKKAYGFSWERV